MKGILTPHPYIMPRMHCKVHSKILYIHAIDSQKKDEKEMLWDLISQPEVLIPHDVHRETDGPFDCAESDQRGYSLWEIRVFPPFLLDFKAYT